MDVAELGIRVDASGAITVLDKFGHKVDEVEGKTSKFEETLKKAAEFLAAFELGHKFMEETIKAQNAMASLERAVRAMGGSAGKTLPELKELAEHIQQTTIFSHDAAEKAAAMQLMFNRISGANFARVQRDAADLATFMETDLVSATEMLGRALQDPANGLTMLQRRLRLFSEDQIRTIKLMADTGDVASAQAIILGALEKRYAGAAAAARNTLGGALAHLKNDFNDLFQISKGGTSGVVVAINMLADALEKIKSSMGTIITLIIAATAAWLAYRTAIITATVVQAVMTSAQTIQAFISLALTIRKVADAAALLTMVGGGWIKVVAVIAALTAGFVAYEVIINKINAASKKFEEDLPKAAPAPVADSTADANRLIDLRAARNAALKAARDEYDIAKQTLLTFGQQATVIEKVKNLQEMFTATQAARVALDKKQIDEAEYADELLNAGRVRALKDQTTDLKYLADVAKQTADQVSTAFTTFFTDMFTTGMKSVTDLVNNIKQLFFRMIGELLAHQLMQKLAMMLTGTGDTSAAMKQLSAAAIMLNAANAQVVAANTMARAAGIPTISNPVGGGAVGGGVGMFGRLAEGGAIAGAGLGIGYGMGSAIGGVKGVGAGVLGGAATGAAIGAMGGPIGVAAGAAIGALAGLAGGIMGMGAAAKRHKAEIEAVQQAYEKFTDDLKVQLGLMTTTDQQIKQLQADTQAQIKAQETAKGRPYNDASKAAIAELNRLEALRIQQLRDEAALTKKLATESIEARRLRALGNSFEADALDLKIAQEKEYADAVKQGLDSTTLAQLKYVQSLEAQKAAADSFTSSALNIPAGYKVAEQLFKALDPERPGPQIDLPSGPTVTTPSGGPAFPTRPGGGGGVNPDLPNGGVDVNTPLILNLDGKTIASTTVGILKRAAQQQFGDTSLWPQVAM